MSSNGITASREVVSAPAAAGTVTVIGAETYSGNSIVEAFAKIASVQSGDITIMLAPGTYEVPFGKGLNYKGGANIKIQGAGTAKYGLDVLIKGRGKDQLSNKTRPVLEVEGTGNLVLENVTIRNTTKRSEVTDTSSSGSPLTQAEALGFDSSGRVAAYNCSFLSHQDTVRTISKSWFYNCYIEGDVDFIWMEANSIVGLYERCKIYMVGDDEKSEGYVLAPRINLAAKVGKGNVIYKSRIIVGDGVNNAYLFRNPWNKETDKGTLYNQGAVVDTEISGALHSDLAKHAAWGHDDHDPKHLGWKVDSAIAGAYSSRLSSIGTVDATTKASEYGGREAILNRMYNLDTSRYERDALTYWNIASVIAENGWKPTADTSSSLGEGETLVNVNRKTYDMMALAVPDSATLAEGSADGISWKGLEDNGNKDWKQAKNGATVTFSVDEPSVVKLEAYQNGVGELSATVGGTKVVDSASACSETAFLTSGAGEVVITFTGQTYFRTITVFTRTNEENKAGAVKVTLSDTQIAKAQATTATATVTPYYLNNMGDDVISSTDVTWTSSKPTIATVNASSGAVSGVAAGTADIIAASKATPSVTGKATLTVTETATTVVPLVTWDFSAKNVKVLNSSKAEAEGAVLQNGATGYLQGTSDKVLIEVSTDNGGKIQARTNNGDAQVNAGLKLRIPVSANSVVTVKNYGSGNDCTYTLGDVTGINNTSKGQEVSWKASSSGYVELEVTTSNYLLSISVTNVDYSADHTSKATGTLQ